MTLRLLITGANRGIGLALTQRALLRGHQVIAGARSTCAELSELGCPRLSVVPLDVTSAESIRSARQMVSGPLDVLINNAGMSGGTQRAPGMDLARAAQILDVNSMGPLRIYDAFVDLLRAGTKPVLVNVSSEAGSLARFRKSGKPEYAMSKAALNALTRWIAVEEQGGLCCVSLDPGWTKTATGGESAPQTTIEAADRMLDAIARLDATHSGGFFDAQLGVIPFLGLGA